MNTESPRERTWSDTQLMDAVAASRSWRGVMRELGLRATSAGSIKVVRRHVTRLGLDTSHFTGQRTWSDAALKRAVSQACSWDELLTAIGLNSRSGDERTRVKAHAVRLGLDFGHLKSSITSRPNPPELEPDLKNLRDAGTSVAAAWFVLRGCNAAFPVEPTVYDLLVSMPQGIRRIQVKTTTFNSKDGWLVQVGRRPYSTGNRARLVPYDPDMIDFFFILDGDLTLYLIPSQVIAGRVHIVLRSYTAYIVGNASGLILESTEHSSTSTPNSAGVGR